MSTLENVDLEDGYVKRLLSDRALRDRRFWKSEFQQLSKYDRRVTLETTHFSGVRALGINDYELVDCLGARAVVAGDWAATKFTEDFLLEVRLCGTAAFTRVRLGSPAASRQGAQLVTVHATGPKITFHNNGAGQRCLYAAFASALYSLGYTSPASVLAREGRRPTTKATGDRARRNSSSDFAAFKKAVLECMAPYGKVRYRKAHYHPESASSHRRNPVAASIKAAKMVNGKKLSVGINHAVCFLDGYTFDANQERALVTSRDSLDAICSAVVPDCFYDGILWARELVLRDDMMTKHQQTQPKAGAIATHLPKPFHVCLPHAPTHDPSPRSVGPTKRKRGCTTHLCENAASTPGCTTHLSR